MTWFEVQQKLVAAQAEHMMCIHKQELTALDVYHRILRYKNYMVAMVNKSLLPLRYTSGSLFSIETKIKHTKQNKKTKQTPLAPSSPPKQK